MDKQIIYNCPHISLTDWGTYACKLYNPRDKNCIVSGGNCGSNISCPYKQLLRKEQECEELKNELIDIKWNIEAQDIELNNKEEQLEAYKMEAEEGKEINAELKAENEDLKKLYEEVCSENLKEIYDLIKKNDLWREIVNVVNGKLEKQLDQLKATLQEIKDYCNKYPQNSIGFKQQILQKIKECEGDNEI